MLESSAAKSSRHDDRLEESLAPSRFSPPRAGHVTALETIDGSRYGAVLADRQFVYGPNALLTLAREFPDIQSSNRLTKLVVLCNQPLRWALSSR